MNAVSFGGWEQGYRTIEKKYKDLGSIDVKIQEYAKKNEAIQKSIDNLRHRLASIVQTFQNVKNMDSKKVNEMTKALNEEIAAKEAEIQRNKEMISALWYGYHERL